MPDEKDGTLTAEERRKAAEWISGHWKGPTAGQCPICQSKSWSLSKHGVQWLILHPSALFGGVTYPQILLICQVCGNTLAFNAVRMGLVKPAVEAQEDENTEQGPLQEATESPERPGNG